MIYLYFLSAPSLLLPIPIFYFSITLIFYYLISKKAENTEFMNKMVVCFTTLKSKLFYNSEALQELNMHKPQTSSLVPYPQCISYKMKNNKRIN